MAPVWFESSSDFIKTRAQSLCLTVKEPSERAGHVLLLHQLDSLRFLVSVLHPCHSFEITLALLNNLPLQSFCLRPSTGKALSLFSPFLSHYGEQFLPFGYFTAYCPSFLCFAQHACHACQLNASETITGANQSSQLLSEIRGSGLLDPIWPLFES